MQPQPILPAPPVAGNRERKERRREAGLTEKREERSKKKSFPFLLWVMMTSTLVLPCTAPPSSHLPPVGKPSAKQNPKKVRKFLFRGKCSLRFWEKFLLFPVQVQLWEGNMAWGASPKQVREFPNQERQKIFPKRKNCTFPKKKMAIVGFLILPFPTNGNLKKIFSVLSFFCTQKGNIQTIFFSEFCFFSFSFSVWKSECDLFAFHRDGIRFARYDVSET